MNWGGKLGKMVFLERRLKDLSVESKITRFGLVITEKSKMEVERNFGIAKNTLEIEMKLNLNWSPNPKIDDTRR